MSAAGQAPDGDVDMRHRHIPLASGAGDGPNTLALGNRSTRGKIAVERDVEDGDTITIAGVDEHPTAAAIDPLHGSRNRGEDWLPGRVALDPGPVERILVLGKVATVRVGAGVVPLHHFPLTTRHRPGNPGALAPGRC